MTNRHDKTHEETYENGLELRKSVLGVEHVNRSLANVSKFSEPIQKFVTEYCWGEVWTSDALDRKTRSLLNLAMLTAMNRMHEFGVHVRGAINNGASIEEIQGVLLQTAVYIGVPAALESFRVAETVLKDMGLDV
jgi:4-carboxymuconolactone decarboxylase